MLVSIVVPMKDEEGSLPLLERELAGLEALLAARGDDLETVLVDDGSVDGTAAAAQAWCDRTPEGAGSRRLVAHAVNRGFGAGFRTGLAESAGDRIVCYDADCAYPAADVIRLLEALDGGADVATATPFTEGGEARGGPLRLLLSRGCSLGYRLALRGRARGTRTFTCAFRAYRAELLRAVEWRADGFLAAAEVLCRVLLAGGRVAEVPSTLRPRVAGVSKMRVVRVALAHLRLQLGLCVRGAV